MLSLCKKPLLLMENGSLGKFELSQSFHTLNSYKGVIVVDVLGKRYPLASKMVNVAAALAKRILKK